MKLEAPLQLPCHVSGRWLAATNRPHQILRRRETLPESGQRAATASAVLLNISISCLQCAIKLLSLLGQSSIIKQVAKRNASDSEPRSNILRTELAIKEEVIKTCPHLKQ